MPKLKNIQRINPSDYPSEYSQLVDGLAGTLNDFMQDVIDMSDGRVDYDNLIFKQLQFEISVGDNGVPLQDFQLKTGVNQPTGFTVVRAVNLSNTFAFASGQPFISYSNAGSDLIKVTNISNLTSGDKYRLTVLVY
jgi:hypothetical protein